MKRQAYQYPFASLDLITIEQLLTGGLTPLSRRVFPP
jgi:hypothetical protein